MSTKASVASPKWSEDFNSFFRFKAFSKECEVKSIYIKVPGLGLTNKKVRNEGLRARKKCFKLLDLSGVSADANLINRESRGRTKELNLKHRESHNIATLLKQARSESSRTFHSPLLHPSQAMSQLATQTMLTMLTMLTVIPLETTQSLPSTQLLPFTQLSRFLHLATQRVRSAPRRTLQAGTTLLSANLFPHHAIRPKVQARNLPQAQLSLTLPATPTKTSLSATTLLPVTLLPSARWSRRTRSKSLPAKETQSKLASRTPLTAFTPATSPKSLPITTSY